MYLEVHKYSKYIVIHLSISTNTFKDLKKELSTSTSTTETVLKYQSTSPQNWSDDHGEEGRVPVKESFSDVV